MFLKLDLVKIRTHYNEVDHEVKEEGLSFEELEKAVPPKIDVMTQKGSLQDVFKSFLQKSDTVNKHELHRNWLGGYCLYPVFAWTALV